LKPLSLNSKEKICHHVDALFGIGVSDAIPEDLEFEYSRKTGRLKNFSIRNQLVATLRTDGGLALTIFGARILIRNKKFIDNCVIPCSEAIPFVSEGRSLFCKHVEWCGSNVKVGSDVAVIDNHGDVLAIGRSVLGYEVMKRYRKGVAVKVREGIKSRVTN
jgi:uncharacterized protein with predicted RNA binding PUA domain